MELIEGIGKLSTWNKLTDLHGFLAMTALFLFGSAFVLYFYSLRNNQSVLWLKRALLALLIDVLALDLMGLLVYIPYRASDGPRTILKASSETAWLHEIVFEHKEFLAFAPPVILFCAWFIVNKLGSNFSDNTNYKWLRYTVFSSLILSLVFVLVVAAEAVLVTKTASVP